METALQLLTPDGALRVTFPCELTSMQYIELLAVANAAETKAELTDEIVLLANQWKLSAEVDSVLALKNR